MTRREIQDVLRRFEAKIKALRPEEVKFLEDILRQVPQPPIKPRPAAAPSWNRRQGSGEGDSIIYKG